jgi:hypothetical protein
MAQEVQWQAQQASRANMSPETSRAALFPTATVEEMSRLDAHFRTADADGDGFVGVKEGANFFKLSELPNGCLKQIWALADPDNAKLLSVEAFTYAFQLIEEAVRHKEMGETTMVVGHQSQSTTLKLTKSKKSVPVAQQLLGSQYEEEERASSFDMPGESARLVRKNDEFASLSASRASGDDAFAASGGDAFAAPSSGGGFGGGGAVGVDFEVNFDEDDGWSAAPAEQPGAPKPGGQMARLRAKKGAEAQAAANAARLAGPAPVADFSVPVCPSSE